MTVQELKQELNKYSDTSEVIVSSYEIPANKIQYVYSANGQVLIRVIDK